MISLHNVIHILPIILIICVRYTQKSTASIMMSLVIHSFDTSLLHQFHRSSACFSTKEYIIIMIKYFFGKTVCCRFVFIIFIHQFLFLLRTMDVRPYIEPFYTKLLSCSCCSGSHNHRQKILISFRTSWSYTQKRKIFYRGGGFLI